MIKNNLIKFCLAPLRWYNLHIRRKLNMRKIHNFTVTGIIPSDSEFIKCRELFERTIVQGMRDGGYVPVLDVLPQFSVSYNMSQDNYTFSLTMFGIFIGKKKSHIIEGFTGQEFIPR